MHNVSVYQDFKQEVMCFSLTFRSFVPGSIVEKVIIWHFIKRRRQPVGGADRPCQLTVVYRAGAQGSSVVRRLGDWGQDWDWDLGSKDSSKVGHVTVTLSASVNPPSQGVNEFRNTKIALD